MIRAVSRPATATYFAASAAMDAGHKHGDTVIKLKATAQGFVPKPITIPAGKEVRLEVDISDAPDCAKSLSFPSLSISGKADPRGKVTLTIPAQTAGKQLGLQCSMAMIKGTVRVTA